jgi:hypothetical protein
MYIKSIACALSTMLPLVLSQAYNGQVFDAPQYNGWNVSITDLQWKEWSNTTWTLPSPSDSNDSNFLLEDFAQRISTAYFGINENISGGWFVEYNPQPAYSNKGYEMPYDLAYDMLYQILVEAHDQVFPPNSVAWYIVAADGGIFANINLLPQEVSSALTFG